MKTLGTVVSALFLIPGVASADATYSVHHHPIRHATGLVRTHQSARFIAESPRKSFGDATTPVPGKFSMRGKAGPVEDQGQCGSCWDFSLTSVLRGSLVMANKDPGRLSFNFLLNCATEMFGCNGGDFSAASHLIGLDSSHLKGAPLYGSDGDYTATDGQCVSKPAAGSAAQYYFIGNDMGTFPQGMAPSFKDIAYVVGVLHKPLSIGVAVDDTWESYGGGVYNGCSSNNPATINHMVSIEGYDCETSVDSTGNCVFDAKGNLPPGVGTWVIRNSWGPTWGDGGYMISKATSTNGDRCNAVASDALYYDLLK